MQNYNPNMADRTLKMNEFLVREMNLHKIIKEQEYTIQKFNKKIADYESQEKEIINVRVQMKETIQQMQLLEQKNQETKKNYEEQILQLQQSLELMKQNYENEIQYRDSSINLLEKQIKQINIDFDRLLVEKDEEIKLIKQASGVKHDQNFEQSLDNYTSEEEYIIQVQKINEFINDMQENLMAQIVHYRRELEMSQKDKLNFQDIHADEKRFLEEKAEKYLLINHNLEQDMNLKLNQFQQELKKLVKELQLKNTQLLKANEEKDNKALKLLDTQIEGEKIWMKEKAELIAQIQIQQESFDTKLNYYEKQINLLSEEKVIEIEKYIRENEILKSEKELLVQNMEDLKKIYNSKEKKLNIEIERLNIAQHKLIDLGQTREDLMQKEIQVLQTSVLELQNAYDQRNKLITLEDKKKDGGNVNWEQMIKNRLVNFDKLNVQMRNALNEKKAGEVLREGRQLITKLTDKLSALDGFKTQQFEKKASDKRLNIANLERALDKFMMITDEFGNKIDQILDRAKDQNIAVNQQEQNKEESFLNSTMRKDIGVSENQNPIEQNINSSKNALNLAFKAVQAEIESTKYDEIITKKDAEINLAKKNLIVYKETIEKLEAKLNEKIEDFKQKKKIKNMNEDEMEEEHLIAKLSSEKIELEKENAIYKKELYELKSEKEIYTQMKDKYESLFIKEIQRIEENYNVKFTEFKKMIQNAEFQNQKQATPNQKNNSLAQSKYISNQSTIKSFAIKGINGGGANKSIMMNNNPNISFTSNGFADKNKETEKMLRLVLNEAESIKAQLKEIEKVYLESERFNNLMEEIKLLEGRCQELQEILEKEIVFIKEQLEQNAYMASVPSKKFDEGFDVFKKHCEQLIELKEQIEKNEQQREKFFQKIQEHFDFTQNQQKNVIKEGTAEEEKNMLKTEILSLTQLIQIERENHKSELEVQLNNMNKTLKLMEKKVESSKQELENLKQVNLESQKNHESFAFVTQKEIKQLKSEIANLSKLINETHVKRIEEKKKFLQQITAMEKEAMNKEEDTRKMIEQKIQKFDDLIETKEKILQQKYNQQRHEEKILEKIKTKYQAQYKNILEEMQKKNQMLQDQIDEINEIQEDKSKRFNLIINDLRINIENLHSEKARLIESINYNNQLIEQKEKQIQLTTQKYQNLTTSILNHSSYNQQVF
ncbi:hypothetical protein TTHERM_01020770 (macronuclear) [Tetrahymena thermophila SB210]|uniref:Uncharacterized protein n=1 Tax=Tetrahymena thermophila (strain SB210) TaxID=312017 RepID=Q24BZ3_TETTS|nr:hypothetical protein TTHERM_01020770 [Tetrahymena thermophila SB210]EAS05309.2 hypothetical protein TTHERM_01020770 [Tetrahymena thermophila SB210]|eukprot:XP_001025554.2 hypothetical protein TTHERM_01020770 [Tetrahymena thermophila SB210]